MDIDALADRARQLGGAGRALLGIAGAPGAGKSTLAEQLVERIGAQAVVVPMDGFHLHDDEQFRVTYDTLWDDLEEEVRKAAETWRRK